MLRMCAFVSLALFVSTEATVRAQQPPDQPGTTPVLSADLIGEWLRVTPSGDTATSSGLLASVGPDAFDLSAPSGEVRTFRYGETDVIELRREGRTVWPITILAGFAVGTVVGYVAMPKNEYNSRCDPTVLHERALYGSECWSHAMKVGGLPGALVGLFTGLAIGRDRWETLAPPMAILDRNGGVGAMLSIRF